MSAKERLAAVLSKESIAYALSSSLLLFALLYAVDWQFTDWRFWRYHITLGPAELFIFLAFVPGVLAIVYHLVTVRERRQQNLADVKKYYEWLKARPAKRAHEGADRVPPATKWPVSANAATLLLTSVFLFVAIVAAYTRWPGTARAGIVYAGLGAYSSVLYFMVARLYASALSSRYLMSSAIDSASSIVLGWVFASIGIGILEIDPKSFNLATLLFLTGLFHKWALDALRRRARKLFSQPDPGTLELPLDTIEGIDDVHADLLSEYGVTTVQHIAKAEPGEICQRTLLPLDRITDWMDQAALIVFLKKNIISARALGIRGAIDLVQVYDRAIVGPPGPMSALLDSLAEKISMPRAAIDAIALKFRGDYAVTLLYALQEGREYTPTTTAVQLVPYVAQELSNNYDFVNGQAASRFEIKRRVQP